MNEYDIELGRITYEAYIENIKRERPTNLMWQVKWSDLPEQNQHWWINVGKTVMVWTLEKLGL